MTRQSFREGPRGYSPYGCFSGKYFHHRFPELRYLALRNVPHKLIVDTQIVMDQLVPRACHFSPFNLRVPGTEVVGDLLYRLADDFEAPDEGPLQGFVAQEGFARDAGGGSDEILRLCQDMLAVANGWFHSGGLFRRRAG